MTVRWSAAGTKLAVRGVLGVALVFLLGACASTPPFAGLTGDEILVSGLAALEAGDWDEAVNSLGRVVAAHPTHPRVDEARLGLARAHFEREEYITAATEYELFLTRYPSHGRAPEASLGICRSYVALSPHPQRDQEYTRRARDACRVTALEFPGTNVAEEADELRARMVEKLAEQQFQHGRFYERRNLYDAAILYYQNVVDFYPQTDWAPRSLAALHRTYEAIGWTEEAESARSRLLSLYPDSEEAEELQADDDG